MKANIHPQWYPQAQVSCACGNTFTVGASKPIIKVEICSACHPFYTGEMRFVDSMGRVEKFQKMQKQAEQNAAVMAEKKKKKEEKELQRKQPKSLKEMLMGLK